MYVGKSDDGEKLSKKNLCSKVALEKTKFFRVDLDDFRFRIRHGLRTPREILYVVVFQCWTKGRSSTAVAEDLRPTATAYL